MHLARSGPMGDLAAPIVALFFAAVALLVAPSAVQAATITVNDSRDPGFTGDGNCTLREAMANADANADTTLGDCGAGTGADTIAFAPSFVVFGDPCAPAGIVCTLSLASPLPALTDTVTIDGTTRCPASTTPCVELSGAGAGASANGLQLAAANSTVKGLAINRFGAAGILVTGAGATIQRSVVGANPAGTTALANAVGIRVQNAANATIGGAASGVGNRIAANTTSNVAIEGAGAGGAQVVGNLIGVSATGGFLGPSDVGVLVDGTPNTVIGGTASGAGNVIGNLGAGIKIQGAGASGNRVEGNFVGIAPNNGDIPNGRGITIDGAPNNVVGGTAAGARNVISFNGLNGLVITGAGATDNQVRGNVIGTIVDGTAGPPAASRRPNGVVLAGGASGNTIGGTTAEARNVISGNGQFGVAIVGDGTTGSLVQGNFIGTDVTGAVAVPNGTFPTGRGILIDASGNTIGGTAPGAGNRIAHNGGVGVTILGGAGTRIQGNAIFANQGLGIDLGLLDGVAVNDPGDADGGPNGLQNFPVLTSAGLGGGALAVAGTLNSAAGTTFRVELFANPTCDGSGNGEGEILLGATNVTTDGGGNASFVASLPAVPLDRVIVATATDPAGNTSEFSACRQVAVTGITVTFAGGQFTTESGATATFTVVLDTVPSADVTIGLSSSDPTEGTVSAGSLTFTPSDAVTPKTVTIAGIDDALFDGDVAYTIVTAPVASADPGYTGQNPPDLNLMNRDNEPAPSACAPRPPVGVAVVAAGAAGLRVTITAGTQPASPTNRLTALQFQPGTNALVDIRGQTNLSGAVTVPLGDRPAQVTFVVRRRVGGQATHLPFTVIDDCGPWQTFIGGGTAAGF